MFFEALRIPMQRNADELQRKLGEGAILVRRFFAQDSFLAVAERGVGSSRQDKTRLFLALSRAIVTLAGLGPTVLLLDDLHWADRSSLDLLAHLVFAVQVASAHERVSLLMVAAFRPGEPGTYLARVVDRLRREEIRSTVELEGFESGQVRELIEGLGISRASHQLVAFLVEATRGNPLFVEELLHHLIRQGQLSKRGATWGLTHSVDPPLPEEVTSIIAGKIQEVSASTRDALTLASHIGDRFSLSTLAALSQTADSDLLVSIEEALRQRLLKDEGANFQFAHPLIRYACYNASSGARRERIHLQIAEQLERSNPDPAHEHFAEIAHHYVNACHVADPAKVMHWAQCAGDHAFATCSWGTAARFYSAALEAGTAAKLLSNLEVGELCYRAGVAHYRDQDPGPCLDMFDKAAEMFARVRSPVGLCRTLAARARTLFTLEPVPYGTLLDIKPLEESVLSIGEHEPALCSEVWATVSEVYWHARQTDRAREAAERALHIAELVGDDSLCAGGRHVLAQVQIQSLSVAEALENWRRSLEHAQRSGDLWLQSWPLQRIPMALTWLGRLDDAEKSVTAAGELTDKTQDWGDYSMALAALVSIDVFRGELVAAERHCQEALKMLYRSRYPWGATLALMALASGRTLRGSFAGAIESLEAVVGSGGIFEQAGPTLQSVISLNRELIRVRSGDAGESRALVQNELAAVTSCGSDIYTLAAQCAIVELADLTGAPGICAEVYPTLSLAAKRGVVFTPGWGFLVPRVAGVAAALCGRWEEAEDHLRAAIGAARRAGAGPQLAHARLDYARMLTTHDAKDARSRAIEELEQAKSLVEDLALEPLAKQAAEVDRALGFQSAPRRPKILYPTSPKEASEHDSPLSKAFFRLEGDYWTIGSGELVRIKDARGLRYIAQLLRYPRREFHVADLAATNIGEVVAGNPLGDDLRTGLGDAGELVDAKAKAQYKQRIEELRGELDLANEWNDSVRATRLREELDSLAENLSAAYGIGGRARKGADSAERLRKAVANRIRDSIARIEKQDQGIGLHLTRSIKTGYFCSYLPEKNIEWQF
jgi:hypothetical protein